MPRSRLILPCILVSLISLSTGCQTTVGNYFANRGRDFGDCFHLQVGFSPGLGVVAKAGGLAHVGLGIGSSSRSTSVGWVYGQGHAFGYPRHSTGEGDPDADYGLDEDNDEEPDWEASDQVEFEHFYIFNHWRVNFLRRPQGE